MKLAGFNSTKYSFNLKTWVSIRARPLPAERINSCYKIWISKPAPQYTDPNTNQIHHPKYQICNTKCKKQPFKKDNYLLLLLKTPYQVPNTPHPKYQICNSKSKYNLLLDKPSKILILKYQISKTIFWEGQLSLAVPQNTIPSTKYTIQNTKYAIPNSKYNLLLNKPSKILNLKYQISNWTF